ncbi:MAG: glycosyltransferase family 2 protein [Legionellaceae bacterium]|nr:glycosyltransferase family 2 protein [Legionellaceae bacterium]
MLSVIVIVKNESRVIRRCLESVAFATELIVLDSGSTDDTVAIAQEFTSHVHSTDWQGYGVQKQRALALATQPWVLNVDADELVDGELQKAILQAITSDEWDAYRIPIRLSFYGKQLRFSGSPTRHVRLFKREGAYYAPDKVHEKITLPAKTRIARIPQAIWHDSYRDLSHAIEKMNKYSSYSAATRARSGYGVGRAICGSIWMFFRNYILQGSVWDGKAGFVLSVLAAQGTFYRYMKICYPDV